MAAEVVTYGCDPSSHENTALVLLTQILMFGKITSGYDQGNCLHGGDEAGDKDAPRAIPGCLEKRIMSNTLTTTLPLPAAEMSEKLRR